MSEIIREVDEEVRRDEMVALARKWGPLVIGVALLVVLATAGYVGWQRYTESSLRSETDQLISAVQAGERSGGDAQVAALEAAAAETAGGRRVLAQLFQAGEMARLGRISDAVELYQGVAGSGDAPAELRDLALLYSVIAQVDSGDPTVLIGELEALADPSNPWRFTAREMMALLEVRRGNVDTAVSLWQALSDDVEAPGTLRSRALELVDYYGG